jgi:hypothetical protein
MVEDGAVVCHAEKGERIWFSFSPFLMSFVSLFVCLFVFVGQKHVLGVAIANAQSNNA